MNKWNWAGTFKNMFFFIQNVGKLRIPLLSLRTLQTDGLRILVTL